MAEIKRLQMDLEEIARKHCLIETLEIRSSDRLDFHEVSVWALQAALQEAYLLGLERGAKGGDK